MLGRERLRPPRQSTSSKRFRFARGSASWASDKHAASMVDWASVRECCLSGEVGSDARMDRRDGFGALRPSTYPVSPGEEEEARPMRIVIVEFISLDGVVQAPGGPEEDTEGGFAHGGWSHPFFDPEVVGGAFNEALTKAEALLFGRRTWQTMAAAWPVRAGDPFADQMNAIPKYVVSSTLREDELTWDNTTRIHGDEAVARIRGLRATDGGDLVVMGSPTLARTLLHEALTDELRLVVMPVILGGGKTIYPHDGALRPLELVSTVASSTGVQVCTYRLASAG